MNLREKYPYIVKWGQMMGSYDYYIDNQCSKADSENAPGNAIYRRNDNFGEISNPGWETTDHITNEGTRLQLGLPPIGKHDRETS